MTMFDSVAARPRVVVGVSGSRASLAALCWAACEAAQRRGDLVAVLAWQPAPVANYAVTASRDDRAKQLEIAEVKLAASVRAAFEDAIPGNLVIQVVEDVAERALPARSADADLLVLGATSAPALTGRGVGPVIRACLSRAHCPVVIIGTDQADRDSARRWKERTSTSAALTMAAAGAGAATAL